MLTLDEAVQYFDIGEKKKIRSGKSGSGVVIYKYRAGASSWKGENLPDADHASL